MVEIDVDHATRDGNGLFGSVLLYEAVKPAPDEPAQSNRFKPL